MQSLLIDFLLSQAFSNFLQKTVNTHDIVLIADFHYDFNKTKTFD